MTEEQPISQPLALLADSLNRFKQRQQVDMYAATSAFAESTISKEPFIADLFSAKFADTILRLRFQAVLAKAQSQRLRALISRKGSIIETINGVLANMQDHTMRLREQIFHLTGQEESISLIDLVNQTASTVAQSLWNTQPVSRDVLARNVNQIYTLWDSLSPVNQDSLNEIGEEGKAINEKRRFNQLLGGIDISLE